MYKPENKDQEYRKRTENEIIINVIHDIYTLKADQHTIKIYFRVCVYKLSKTNPFTCKIKSEKNIYHYSF